MVCPAMGTLRSAIGCCLLTLAAAGTDRDGSVPEGVLELQSSNFDMTMFNVRSPLHHRSNNRLGPDHYVCRGFLQGTVWVVEFYAPWCPRCKSMAPTLQDLAGNLRSVSDANESYAVSIVNAEVSIAVGLRFLVTQYPTLYAVCGQHVTPLSKRRADDLTGEVHAWALSTCRSRGLMEMDLRTLKDAFNPFSPMAVWHTIPFFVLGLTTSPLAYISPFLANMVLLSALALMWMLPIVVPLVTIAISCCESREDEQPKADEQTADQAIPSAAEPKKNN